MPTANYTTAADAFSRRTQWVVEIDLDRCDNQYTQDDAATTFCEASDQGDGSRCYYSFSTCQDPTNYVKGTRTWRFCLVDVPWSDTANPAHPYLREPVFIPQKIDPQKIWTFPEKLRIKMVRDFLPHAPDSDKGGTSPNEYYNTAAVGEFWSNLLARTRNWPGKTIRIKRGFADLALADFEQVGPSYEWTKFKHGINDIEITAESPMVKLNKVKIPFAISESNTVQSNINDSVTSVTVADGTEFPDPADYTRLAAKIYVRMESEICNVSAIAGNVLTIERGSLNTTNAAHNAGVKVEHVVFFGTDNGTSTAPTGQNVVEVILDALEWAGVASGDVNTGSFRIVKNQAWQRLELERLLSKSRKVSKLLQPLRESRGILLYIGADGDWTASVMAPNQAPTDITDESIAEGSVSIEDDSEKRITRAWLWYAPSDADADSDDPKDYTKAVAVVDGTLENANNFNGSVADVLTEPWLDSGTATADAALVARRLLTRRRYGERRIAFTLDVKDATGLGVGDDVRIMTRHLLDRNGDQEARHCVIVEKSDTKRAQTKFVAADTGYNGRYMRIGTDGMSDTYDAATAEERTLGYWGDTNNRVGSTKDVGYIYW